MHRGECGLRFPRSGGIPLAATEPVRVALAALAEAVAAEVDAVPLTVAGYLAAAGTAIAVDEDTASVIAGWDPDATFWLTVRPEPKEEPEAWAWDDDRVWARA